MLAGLDAVLLDVDDTLLDTRASFASAIDAVAERYLPHLDSDGREVALEVWRADAGGHFRAHTRGELTLAEQRRLRARDLHARLGAPPLTDSEHAEWDQVWMAGFRAGTAAHPDAEPFVRALLAAGLRVGALTNAQSSIAGPRLAHVGLAGLVPIVVSLDTLGFGKPDPRVFAEAAARLGSAPARTAYVGDELDVDAIAATRAGLQGVWLDRPAVRRGGAHVEDPGVAARAGVPVVRDLPELARIWGLKS